VGFSSEPLYRSEAFDLALDLAGKASAGQILVTDLACKMAGPIFTFQAIGPKKEAQRFVVKELLADAKTDMDALAKKVPLPFIEETISKARTQDTQWLHIEGWPPTACLHLMDVISAHTERARFHTYRLRLATATDSEQVGQNVFDQLKLIARLRERSEGNEPFANIKTNVMSAVTAMKVLCMRGPTAIIIYGIDSLSVLMRAFGPKGLEEISKLPLLIAAMGNKSDTASHVSVRLEGSIPGSLQEINSYRLALPKLPPVPEGVNTDLVTMLDMLSPVARHAVRILVQTGKSAMTPGDREIGMMIGKELLISGLFSLSDNLIVYRDEPIRDALKLFFTGSNS
jgi:hypothetical protein